VWLLDRRFWGAMAAAVSSAGYPEASGTHRKEEVPQLESFTVSSTFDVLSFQQALDTWLEKWHMQSAPPWLVGWYNNLRDETAGGLQRVDADDGSVAFVICSLPRYIDVVAEHYARSKPQNNFVDAATNEILELLKKKLPMELDAVLTNTDMGPPYYHVQTIGAVCGHDEHIEAEDINDAEWCEDLSMDLEDTRDPKMWGTDPAQRRKIFGVNVNPKFGGWFAYRILLVLRGVKSDSLLEPLLQPAPLKFLELENAKRILHEYNLRHDLCLWRDVTATHPANCRYPPEEYFFYTENKPAKRKQFLEMKAAQLPELPKLRA